MKNQFRNFFASLPLGARLIVLVNALSFPVAWVGLTTHTFDLYGWLGLAPALVWKGQIWRLVTYGLLAAGPIDWLVGTFWLATLVSLVGRNWSSLGFWGYCLLGIFAGAVPIVLLRPGMQAVWVSNAGMLFALIAAWDWLYRNERLILLGFGEISVRQGAILVAIVNSAILFFCAGWFFMMAMWCGGVAGGLWITIRAKVFLGKTPQQIRSERVARLEL
jgi:membrane associated rhomboid family serine protease